MPKKKKGSRKPTPEHISNVSAADGPPIERRLTDVEIQRLNVFVKSHGKNWERVKSEGCATYNTGKLTASKEGDNISAFEKALGRARIKNQVARGLMTFLNLQAIAYALSVSVCDVVSAVWGKPFKLPREHREPTQETQQHASNELPAVKLNSVAPGALFTMSVNDLVTCGWLRPGPNRSVFHAIDELMVPVLSGVLGVTKDKETFGDADHWGKEVIPRLDGLLHYAVRRPADGKLPTQRDVVAYCMAFPLTPECYEKTVRGKLNPGKVAATELLPLDQNVGAERDLYFDIIARLGLEERGAAHAYSKLMQAFVATLNRLASEEGIFINRICAYTWKNPRGENQPQGSEVCRAFGMKLTKSLCIDEDGQKFSIWAGTGLAAVGSGEVERIARLANREHPGSIDLLALRQLYDEHFRREKPAGGEFTVRWERNEQEVAEVWHSDHAQYGDAHWPLEKLLGLWAEWPAGSQNLYASGSNVGDAGLWPITDAFATALKAGTKSEDDFGPEIVKKAKLRGNAIRCWLLSDVVIKVPEHQRTRAMAILLERTIRSCFGFFESEYPQSILSIGFNEGWKLPADSNPGDWNRKLEALGFVRVDRSAPEPVFELCLETEADFAVLLARAETYAVDCPVAKPAGRLVQKPVGKFEKGVVAKRRSRGKRKPKPNRGKRS